MRPHLIARRSLLCRLVSRTASTSSGGGVSAASSVWCARTSHSLALHCPLPRPAFARFRAAVDGHHLRQLTGRRSEQPLQRQVGVLPLACGACFSVASRAVLPQPRPNTSVEGTAQKLRFWVPSLRSAAPHLGRYAALISTDIVSCQ